MSKKDDNKYVVGGLDNRGIRTPRRAHGHRESIAFCGSFPLAEAQRNAQLIAEAFNVTAETGLAPRELQEQRNELLGTLKEMVKVHTVGLDAAGAKHYARKVIAKAEGKANG
jgi:hypothetical protein